MSIRTRRTNHIQRTNAPTFIDDDIFQSDVDYLASLWQRVPVGNRDVPVIDIGKGDPLVIVPILEHLDFVYAHQIQALSKTRRVIFYQRHESRNRPVGAVERAEELREFLDAMGLERVDLLGHGDAAIVLFEFLMRHPQRCRAAITFVQGPDYIIDPHPLIWILHELMIRLPIEHIPPGSLVNRILAHIVANYASARDKQHNVQVGIPHRIFARQFRTISQWAAVYKYSVLPVIHNFDMHTRLAPLIMPLLVFNRFDDRLTPERKTRWLSEHLPNCAGYHVIAGGDRFFMYAQADEVNPLIEQFLASQPHERNEVAQKQ